VEPRYPRKQVREEPLGIPQKRAFALHVPKLLEEDEGDDLRIRKPLYGLVASSIRVEQRVGMLGSGHPGFGWPLLYRQSMQHTSSRSQNSGFNRYTLFYD
jgi:hypothetical protein